MKARKPRNFWTVETTSKEALKYKSRSDFAKGSAKAYYAAWKNKWLDKVCSHMEISPIYSDVRWDTESANIEALKHKSRSEFKRENNGAYSYLLGNNILDYACSHMISKFNQWDRDSVILEAKKYLKRCDFKKSSYSAYKHARKNGYIDEACYHMKDIVCWTRDLVYEEAKKYSNQIDFRDCCAGAWKHAYANGFLEEATVHMEPGICGFSKIKPAILYYIKFVIDGVSKPLYKIGITNRDVKDRLKGMLVFSGVTPEILKEIKFDNGIEAREAEKGYHKKFAEFRYRGKNIMKNGNKELFTQDVLAHYAT